METKYDADDYWAQVISLLTGYSMPSREQLFEKLKSKEGIPLMRVNIVAHEMRAVTEADYSLSTGWQVSHGEDYRLAFYATHGDATKVTLYTADIVFIGTLLGPDGRGHLSDAGSTREGGTFTGKYGDEWDDGDLWRYVTGPKFVMDALLTNHTTKGFSFSGVNVADADAVDLESFERTAQSFDRAAKFFVDHANTLEQWEKSLGNEQAAWKGQAAGVFWNLIHTLSKNYESYVDQFGGPEYHPVNTTIDNYSPKSKYADMLAGAQRNLYDEGVKLRDAWNTWANTAQHDPHRALLEELDELSRWVIRNNVPYVQVTIDSTQAATSGDNEGTWSATTYTYSTVPPFSDNAGFGNLDDINTWKTIGERAITRWNNYIEQYLTPTAKNSLSTLGNNWTNAAEDMADPLETKNTETLSESYQEEQAKIERDAARKAADEANKKSQEAWETLNKNLSDSNQNNKELFDGLNKNLGDANKNQQQLNQNIEGIGNSFGDGLNNLGDNFRKADLNPNPNLTGLGLPDGSDSSSTFGLNDDLGSDLGGDFDLNGDFGDDLGPGGDFDLNGDSGKDLDLGGNQIGLGGNDSITTPLNGDPGGSEGDPSLPAGPLPPSFQMPTNTQIPTSTHTTSPLNNSDFGNGAQLDDNGNLVQQFPDGSQSVFNPETGEFTYTDPQGHTTTSPLNPGEIITNPDGSHTVLNPDGTLTTTFPDGGSQVFDPSDGSLLTTDPDGSTTTTDLNDLPRPGAAPGLDGGVQHNSGFPSPAQHSGGSSPLNGSLLSGGSDLDDGYQDYDSTPFTGGTLGGPLGDYGGDLGGAGGAPLNGPGGTPLNPGMGGMGGAGAGGGGSNGERVRTVMGDTGGASLRRPGGPAPIMDGGETPFRRGGPATTSSGTPMGGGGAPMGGAQGAQSTESGDRQRASWVNEDEDVWGTEEDGAPAVIG